MVPRNLVVDPRADVKESSATRAAIRLRRADECTSRMIMWSEMTSRTARRDSRGLFRLAFRTYPIGRNFCEATSSGPARLKWM
jgi:hypothetical protein